MALPRMFKQKAPNRFDYQPIYWDQAKEEREERIRRIKAEMGYDVSSERRATSSTITRGSFRQYSKHKVKATRESNRRIFLIVGFFLLIAYILFYK